MPDDDAKGVKVLSELDFGTYIAFFLPGVLGLYALIPFSKRVADLFTQVVMKDTTVGATFLLLVGGLVVGTVVSGLRAVFLDRLLVWHKPEFNWGSLSNKDTRAAYKDAVNNTYRFYQFYGNMLLALGFYVMVRYFVIGVDYRTELKIVAIDGIVLLGLILQARKSLKNTYSVMGQILGIVPPGLSVKTRSLPDGKMGQAYKQALEAKGAPPFTWTKTGTGSLPAGLSLDACGGISGTPTTKETPTFTLTVTDASGASKSKEFSINIEQ